MTHLQTPVKAIAEIVINVLDIAKMQRFYEDVLGFAFFRQFPADDPTIVFLTIADLDSPLGHGGHPQLFALIDVHRHRPGQFQGIDQRLTSLNHLAFEISPDDFETEKQRLEDHGLEVRIQTFPHMNARALFFTDPEDNRLEFTGIYLSRRDFGHFIATPVPTIQRECDYRKTLVTCIE